MKCVPEADRVGSVPLLSILFCERMLAVGDGYICVFCHATVERNERESHRPECCTVTHEKLPEARESGGETPDHPTPNSWLDGRGPTRHQYVISTDL
jgi:hypothetical protein